MQRIMRTAIAVTVATLALGAAAPAMASGHAVLPNVVVGSGSCSAGSTWLLTLKPDSTTRIEADLEVQTGVAGQAWRSKFFDNGAKFGHGSKVTLADGSFSITRYATDQAGSDVITVKSKNVTTGETCLATATF